MKVYWCEKMQDVIVNFKKPVEISRAEEFMKKQLGKELNEEGRSLTPQRSGTHLCESRSIERAFKSKVMGRMNDEVKKFESTVTDDLKKTLNKFESNEQIAHTELTKQNNNCTLPNRSVYAIAFCATTGS